MSKRLVIMTVGKTHSGKTTFAKALEQKLKNAFVMDQDNHAEFINTYYRKLQPEEGPNTLKHDLTKVIVDYAIKYTDYHLIVCNSNRSRSGRLHLLRGLYNPKQFVRILVHFDIPDDILRERVKNSKRSTNIFRFAFDFEEVLERQEADSQSEDISVPGEDEADYLFEMKDNAEKKSVINKIVRIAEEKS